MGNVASLSALETVARGGQRLGRKEGAPGVVISEVKGVGIASLSARRGAAVELADKVLATLGVALPAQRKRTVAGAVSVVWSAPDQWLVLFGEGGRSRIAELADAVAGIGSVTDQTDSRCILSVSGPQARSTLAKGVMLDLHPRAFAVGDTAVTLVAHIGAQVTLLDDAPTFQLLVPRSFCLSFWDWLIESASQYGIQTD